MRLLVKEAQVPPSEAVRLVAGIAKQAHAVRKKALYAAALRVDKEGPREK